MPGKTARDVQKSPQSQQIIMGADWYLKKQIPSYTWVKHNSLIN